MYEKGKQNPGVHLVLGGSKPFALMMKPEVVHVLSVMKDQSQVQSHNMCFVFQFLKQKGQEAKGPGMLPLPYNWKVKDFGSFINKKRAGINLCLEP